MMENTIVIFGSLLLMIEWCYSMMPSISGMFGFQIHPLSTIFHFLGLAKSKVNSKLQESKLLTSSMSNFNDTLKTMSILGNPWNNEGFLLYVIFFGHSRVHQVNWMVLETTELIAFLYFTKQKCAKGTHGYHSLVVLFCL